MDIKEEGLKSTVKFEASQNCYEEPKLETEDYEDFSSYHHDIDYTLSYDQDYFQVLNY